MVMHDPFAMRPFFGYNFGDYLKHWISFGKKENLQLPQVGGPGGGPNPRPKCGKKSGSISCNIAHDENLRIDTD